LQDRLKAIAVDLGGLDAIAAKHPEIAKAVEAHGVEAKKAVNSSAIREAADRVIQLQGAVFGMTNAGSVTKLDEAEDAPETDLEAKISGKEGKLLIRIHAYKERDRNLTKMVKKSFKGKHGGKLLCEACGLDPVDRYGPNGERAIEAHHKIPIEELQPDSITRVDDMAIVCASCHRVIHSKKPCLTIAQVQTLLNMPPSQHK
jgi:predicted HNH restriction endonuclease